MNRIFTFSSMLSIAATMAISANTRAEVAPPIVNEIPADAVTTVYTRDAVAWAGNGTEVSPTAVVAYKTELATSGNKVYWQNPVYGSEVGSCLVGEIQDNEIVFSFPQTFYSETYGDDVRTLYLYPFEYLDEYNLFVQADYSEIRFTIEEDGTITMPDRTTIGVGNLSNLGTFTWAGAGFSLVSLTPFSATMVVAPEDAVFEQWVMEETFSNSMKFVEVAFVDNDVYFKGFSKNNPEFTFKGTLANNKITCESGQYIGDYEKNYFIRFMNGRQIVVPDASEYDDPVFELSDQPFVFTLNSTNNALRAEQPANFILFSASATTALPILAIENPYLYRQEEINPKTPKAPYNLSRITDDWDYSQIDFLVFSLYDTNTNGQFFPQADLYFEIITDGEPFSFTRRNGYPNLRESISQVPVELANSYFKGGLNQTVQFKSRDYQSLGVRLVYKDKDGTFYYSPISYFPDLMPGAVTEIDGDEIPVTVDYYDTHGRKVTADNAGIVIRKATMANGRVEISKIFN